MFSDNARWVLITSGSALEVERSFGLVIRTRWIVIYDLVYCCCIAIFIVMMPRLSFSRTFLLYCIYSVISIIALLYSLFIFTSWDILPIKMVWRQCERARASRCIIASSLPNNLGFAPICPYHVNVQSIHKTLITQLTRPKKPAIIELHDKWHVQSAYSADDNSPYLLRHHIRGLAVLASPKVLLINWDHKGGSLPTSLKVS